MKRHLPYPVTAEQMYLDAVLGELRAIRELLAPPVSKPADELFPEEVRLKEPKRAELVLGDPGAGDPRGE